MKTFITKVFIICVAAILTSMLIGDIVHVGDTTITQEASKNYNGYLSIELENKLIELGFYYEKEINTGLYGYFYEITDDFIQIRLYDVFFIDVYNYTGSFDAVYNKVNLFYELSTTFEIIQISYNDNMIYYDNQSPGVYNGMKIMIVGLSNYEVQP